MKKIFTPLPPPMKPSSSPSENTTPQHTPTDYAAIVEKHAAYTLTPTTRPDDLLRFESLIRNLGDLRWKIPYGAGQLRVRTWICGVN